MLEEEGRWFASVDGGGSGWGLSLKGTGQTLTPITKVEMFNEDSYSETSFSLEYNHILNIDL